MLCVCVCIHIDTIVSGGNVNSKLLMFWAVMDSCFGLLSSEGKYHVDINTCGFSYNVVYQIFHFYIKIIAFNDKNLKSINFFFTKFIKNTYTNSFKYVSEDEFLLCLRPSTYVCDFHYFMEAFIILL